MRACGVKLYYKLTSGGSYTQLIGLKRLKPPHEKRGVVEDSDLDSCATGALKSLGTLEPGDFSFSLRYTTAKKTTMQSIKNNGETWWKIEMPLQDGQAIPDNLEFRAFITDDNFSDFTPDQNAVVTLDATAALMATYTFNAGS